MNPESKPSETARTQVDAQVAQDPPSALAGSLGSAIGPFWGSVSEAYKSHKGIAVGTFGVRVI